MKNHIRSFNLYKEKLTDSDASEFLMLILEHSRELLVILDADLKIIAFNKKAAELCPQIFNANLIIGQSIWEYVAEERLAFVLQVAEKLKSGQFIEYTHILPNKDRDAFYTYQIKFVPILDQAKKLNKVIFSGIDISKEAKLMQDGEASKNLLQHAEAIAGIGSWEWDIISDTVLWSDEFCRICGVVPGKIIPSKEKGFAFIHPSDREMAEKILENSFKTGNPYSVQLRLITNDGALKYIHSRGIIIRNEAGRNEKFIGTFHDITALKMLETSIEQTQLKFQHLIENSVDVMLLVNDKREVIFASPSVQTMMGYHPEEILGIRLAQLAAKEDLPEMLIHFEKILSSPSVPYTLEYRVNTKEGNLKWVEGTINNLLHVEGVNSIVINQRDISKRKETEKLLQQLNESLEKQAIELSASNVELEKFAYIASHDLQQPLRMVNSFLKLLQKKYEDQLDETAQQYINYAVDGGERMKELINALMEYSRLGTKNLSCEQIDMNTIAHYVVNLFSKTIKESNALVQIHNLPILYADKIRMRQLLQNLLGNALKYKADKFPQIDISAENKNGSWVFCVADNGIGIKEKDSSKIFEIFRRLHTQTEYEGTGIGLSICKKIVEAHGGKIWIEPNEPMGTKFFFSIKILGDV
ncbi:MAG: PAS domain S-box protein [Ferruginibacter sp.]